MASAPYRGRNIDELGSASFEVLQHLFHGQFLKIILCFRLHVECRTGQVELIFLTPASVHMSTRPSTRRSAAGILSVSQISVLETEWYPHQHILLQQPQVSSFISNAHHENMPAAAKTCSFCARVG